MLSLEAVENKRAQACRVWLVKALVGACALMVACVMWSGSASAAQTWRIDSHSDTTVAAGDEFEIMVQATNVGDAAMDGSGIAVTGSLPAGVTIVDARFFEDPTNDPFGTNFVGCTAGDGISSVVGASDVQCTSSFPVPPTENFLQVSYQLLRLQVQVDGNVSDGSTLTSRFAVVGGGAPAASTVDPIRVAPVPPGFGIDAFDGLVADAAGQPLTQAGGHPDSATVWIDFNTATKPVPTAGTGWPIAPVKDILVDLPPGFVGDPRAAEKCTFVQLANSAQPGTPPLCPPTSQVGVATLRENGLPLYAPILGPIAVYNMVPPPGKPARFAFAAFGGAIALMDGDVRSGGDYGVSVKTTNVPAAISLAGATVTFWGVPSSASHDNERYCPGQSQPGGTMCRSGAPPRAFLRNPTSCPDPGVGLETRVQVDSWFDPGTYESASFMSHLLPGHPAAREDWGDERGTTGCPRVPFKPTIANAPATGRANEPAALSFDVGLPQTNDPDLIGTSDLKSAVVTLPAGMRVSPSSAGGLEACTPAQIGLHENSPSHCPPASKVGSVRITTPLLDDPIDGSVYLAAQRDNPFGTLLALYIEAEGAGVVVKVAGKVEADPVSGQLTTTFDDNPQLPFSNLHLQLNGGNRAPLVTPRQCGIHTTRAVLTGWSGKVVETSSSFAISGDGNGGPCPPSSFSPGFAAGTERPIAGGATPFHLRLTRSDGDEELRSLVVHMPDGLTGKIANVPLCSETDARTGSCPEASRIGRVTVGAGAGSEPFFVEGGRAYLTGPYKGAPFGVSIVVPAVAGPFNLGNVSVRSALLVDKHDATVRIVSDPFPTILEGIPLDVRDVRVSVDRPDFILNPTSCAEKRIDGSIESAAGTIVNRSSRFEIGDCRWLGFKPRMVLAVGGRGHTARNATSPLSTTLTMPPRDQTNLKSVRVTLPTTINARLTVINDACTRAEFEASLRNCDHARAGVATAVTPLLRDPLSGNVYFVKNGHPIPDLFIALRGQVDFDLIGRVSIPGGKHLATTFDAVPDVPVRSFTLRLVGDRANGSVGAATNLCSRRGRTAKAELDYVAQNGRVLQVEQAPKVQGCARHKARKSNHHRRHHGRRGGR